MSDLKITNRLLEERVVTIREDGSPSLLNLGALRRLVAECSDMTDAANVYASRLSDSSSYVGLKWVGRIDVRGAVLDPFPPVGAA